MSESNANPLDPNFKEFGARENHIIQLFSGQASWEERYKLLIDLGKHSEPLAENLKNEVFKVKGCQSQVWLVPSFNNGRVYFTADSDASIVKGIVTLLVYAYSGLSPSEIMLARPQFIDQIGLRQHLSMSRANGLNSMLKQIVMYAVAFDAKAKMGNN